MQQITYIIITNFLWMSKYTYIDIDDGDQTVAHTTWKKSGQKFEK